MKQWRGRSSLPWAGALMIVLLVTAGPPSAHSSATGSADPAATTGIEQWREHLEALDPSRPIAYFELAERVADAAGTDELDALARHLFSLAGVLAPDELGRSVALALADMESDAARAEQLRVLAASLTPAGTVWNEVPIGTGSGDLARAIDRTRGRAIVDAFSFYRRGFGARAIGTLRRADAVGALRALDRLLPGGGADRFLAEAEQMRPSLPPSLGESRLEQMLQLEYGILMPDEMRWSTDLIWSRRTPLLEFDPRRLEELFGVDGERTLYRDGRWVSPRGRSSGG